MLEVLYFIGMGIFATSAYCAIGARTSKLLHSRFGCEEGGSDSFFGGLFWPVVLPTLAIYHAPKLLAAPFKAPGGLLAKPDEIIPGVARPTDILEGMIAAKVLKDYTKIIKEYRERAWLDGDIRVHQDLDRDGNVANNPIRYYIGEQPFKAHHKGPLAKALFQAEKLKKEHDAAEAIAKQEHSALSVIETLMITPKGV